MDKGKATASGSPILSDKRKTIANSPQHKIKRRKLIEKARQVLPEEIFQQIQRKTVDHKEIISKIISKNKRNIIITNKSNPRILKFIETGNWDMQEIEWGITRQVIFRHQDRTEWIKFPAIIRHLINRTFDRNDTHITFELFSTIGWREETKFFQPYQIWWFDSPRSCHLFNLGYNTDAINHKGYWMNSFIEVVKEARRLLKSFDDHLIMTDGRRIFATKKYIQRSGVNHSRTHKEIDEARTILKKLAYRQDMLDVPREFRWFTNNISKRAREPTNTVHPTSPVLSPDYCHPSHQ